MNFGEKANAIIRDTFTNPLKTSYILKKGGKRIVLYQGGDNSGADLSNLDLSGLDLKNIKLTGVNLKNTNLTETNLAGADLEKANLSGANLSGTVLSGASLKDAKIDDEYLGKVIDANKILSDGIDISKKGGQGGNFK